MKIKKPKLETVFDAGLFITEQLKHDLEEPSKHITIRTSVSDKSLTIVCSDFAMATPFIKSLESEQKLGPFAVRIEQRPKK